ncbi:MAG: GGDEF domain-containing protein, partial [Gammaproteobacteria bacterium]|nr:GGDEF domain-containing protein [Gammaproteobacteria bacterium]
MSVTPINVNDDVLKATKTYRQQRRHVIALYLLALFVMVVLFGWLLSEQHKQEIEAAESRITARANVVTEWAKGVFAQSGQALFGLAELLALQGMPEGDNIQAFQRALENLTLYVPMVDAIAVVDSEGRLVASGRVNRRANADVSESAFFNAFKQAGQEELITPLYWSDIHQRYYLYHGRRLETSAGEFAGVAISSIVPEVFADSLEQMSVYDGESIALVDPGLKFIARYPVPEEQFTTGSQIVSPETTEWLARGESTWSINIDSPIDGRKRLFRMLRVGEYPMLAVVGVD